MYAIGFFQGLLGYFCPEIVIGEFLLYYYTTSYKEWHTYYV